MMNVKILEGKLKEIIKEDFGLGDLTTSLVENKRVKARIITNSYGVISGMSELKTLFHLFGIKVLKSSSEGEKIRPLKEIFLLEGDSHNILSVERSALNLLSRMSGISTLTYSFIEKVKDINPTLKIAATRKTTPLFSYFAKRAVKAGGGDTHRLGLYDMVLIKDNHLTLFKNNIKKAIKKAKEETSFTHKIEIEVSNKEEALEAAKYGADIIMLDNFSPEEIKKTVDKLKKEKLRDKIILEASGNITLKNVREYAKSGVDVLSVGTLTHSAPALDFSLEII